MGEKMYGGGVQFGSAMQQALRVCEFGEVPALIGLHFDKGQLGKLLYSVLSLGVTFRGNLRNKQIIVFDRQAERIQTETPNQLALLFLTSTGKTCRQPVLFVTFLKSHFTTWAPQNRCKLSIF